MLEIYHEHCANCFKRACTHDFVSTCHMINCKNHCGAIFHACKWEEHEYLCPQAFRSCINVKYGCPLNILQNQMNGHLQSCPASTVVCTMEWSRVLVQREDTLPTEFFNSASSTTRQLDIALALHDQCVALQSVQLKMQEKSVYTESKVHTNSAANNLQAYIEKQLKLNHGEDPSRLQINDFANFPYADSSITTGLSTSVDAMPTDSIDSLAAECPSELSRTLSDVSDCDSVEVLWGNVANSREIGRAIREQLSLRQDDLIMTNSYSDSYYSRLAFHRVIECLPRYDSKARGMFTFMCNSLLRRDEFSSHYQNFHCDFHGCMNGWLEERCPFYFSGCNYTRFRLLPDAPDFALTFDNVRSCLAVQYSRLSKVPKAFDHEPHLLNLPWEVLKQIVGYLDSYSIGQVSSTCIYLKNLCFTLLKERGIVEMEWKNCDAERGFKWKECGHRWMFSNKCSAVKKWVLNKEPNMASHIVKCPYAKKDVNDYSQSTRYKLLSLGERRKKKL